MLPSTRCSRRSGEPRRRELVAKVKNYITKKNKDGDHSLQLLDLEPQFNWYGMDAQQRAKIFDDGVHMTDYGYQQYMAGLIYNGLVNILKV